MKTTNIGKKTNTSPLSSDEAAELARCEAAITGNLAGANAARDAMDEIQKLRGSSSIEEGVIDDEPVEAALPKVDQVGQAITVPVISKAFANRPAFTSLMREVSALKAKFKNLAEGKGGEWASRRIQQFDADVNNLHAQIRFSIPHAVCPYCGGQRCSQCKRTGWLPEDIYKAVPAEVKGQGAVHAS